MTRRSHHYGHGLHTVWCFIRALETVHTCVLQSGIDQYPLSSLCRAFYFQLSLKKSLCTPARHPWSTPLSTARMLCFCIAASSAFKSTGAGTIAPSQLPAPTFIVNLNPSKETSAMELTRLMAPWVDFGMVRGVVGCTFSLSRWIASSAMPTSLRNAMSTSIRHASMRAICSRTSNSRFKKISSSLTLGDSTILCNDFRSSSKISPRRTISASPTLRFPMFGIIIAFNVKHRPSARRRSSSSRLRYCLFASTFRFAEVNAG
ncbi:hypothetical protein BD410DRAFT_501863 [Rickenella mellea]|uniref:Secreted protein n=1 Tax=Rickenella mellea TaxID=50990 RepID=A0A4Y7PDK8_9AGAM|nr:hypothetical protein BD410DRAFT_501863 [Rickenella mellea]